MSPPERLEVPATRSPDLVMALNVLGATVAEVNGVVEGWVALYVFLPADPVAELDCRRIVEAYRQP